MIRPAVGSVLVVQWGVSMQMVNFYRVVAHKGEKSLVLHELQSEVTKITGHLSGLCTPTHDLTVPYHMTASGWNSGDDFVCRWNPDGHVKFASFAFAYPWDGKPVPFDYCD